jgi:7-carboxy-7-deazaguanine synthase
MYAVEGGDYVKMTPHEIESKCYDLGVKRVILTGGEPLIQPDACDLVDLLCDCGYEVEIETNGAVDLLAFHKKLKTTCRSGLSYTMDVKSPSSGMFPNMNLDNLQFLGRGDVVKFVVGTLEDLDSMYGILKNMEVDAKVFVSPEFGKITAKQIVDYILEKKLDNVRVQIQLHKVIWDPDKRGV